MTTHAKKVFDFTLLNTKEVDRDGQKYGIIEGYASTYGNIDLGGDVVIKGAFDASLADYRKQNKPIPIYYQHNGMRVIGGAPIDKVTSDDKGLKVTVELNLDVQDGREAYALAKQGVIGAMSIGYGISDCEYTQDGVCLLKALNLYEISMVCHPMNPEAKFTAVKSLSNYPIADNTAVWDAAEAKSRIEAAGFEVKAACLIADNDATLCMDVIDNQLKIVPAAVFDLAGRLHGAKNGMKLSIEQRDGLKTAITNYYEKMGLSSPFAVKTVKEFSTIGDFEAYLESPYSLSKDDRKVFISKLKELSGRDVADNTKGLSGREVTDTTETLQEVNRQLDLIILNQAITKQLEVLTNV